MTDVKDIEQRAKDMIEQCQRRKVQRENAEGVDRMFRESIRKKIKEETNRENAERERQELENRWSPYLEKAMKRYGTEFEGVLKE